MYKELIQPGHKKTFDFCHSLDLPVIVHSCGYVAPLVPGLIEAGMDCLQAMEVKAGMDLLQLHRDFGDRIAFCGGMDTRNLLTNDLNAMMTELDEKIPVVKKALAIYSSLIILFPTHAIMKLIRVSSMRGYGWGHIDEFMQEQGELSMKFSNRTRYQPVRQRL